MKDLLVSVIVPVYNVESYVGEAIESIIHQTYKNLEIIVIDDGSTDASGKICKHYAEMDSRIILIHQENHGLSTARNVGLDYATGDIIAFLDSDDAYQSETIQVMTESLLNQNADVVICNFSWQKTTERMKPTIPSSSSIRERVLDKKGILCEIADGRIDRAPWNKLYLRKIWDGFRFPNGRVYEGTYTVFDLFSRVDRVVIIDEELIMHRVRSNSIVNTQSLTNIKDKIWAYSYFVSYIKKHTPEFFTEAQCQKIAQSVLSETIVTYLLFRNRKDSEGKQFCKELKKQIVDAGKTIKIHGLRRKIAYYMICCCPWLLQIVYSVYRRMRINERKAIGP